jgi:hypothetical protein
MNALFDKRYEMPLARLDPKEVLDALTAEIRRLNLNLNVHALGIPDAHDDGGWCIHPEGDVWLVYIAERGRRRSPAIFMHPFDAANYFVWVHMCHPAADGTSVSCIPRLRTAALGH